MNDKHFKVWMIRQCHGSRRDESSNMNMLKRMTSYVKNVEKTFIANKTTCVYSIYFIGEVNECSLYHGSISEVKIGSLSTHK
jgi:hypothetical protein